MRSFSIKEARAANLLNKPGPWQQYQDRMLWWRAFGWAARDGFADVLKGVWSREEADDCEVTLMPASVPTVVRQSLPLKPSETSRDEKRMGTSVFQPDSHREHVKLQHDVRITSQGGAMEQFKEQVPIEFSGASVGKEIRPELKVENIQNESGITLTRKIDPIAFMRNEIRSMVLRIAGGDLQVAGNILKGFSRKDLPDGSYQVGFGSVRDPRATDERIEEIYPVVKTEFIEKFGNELDGLPGI